jgi:hypothetical protein
MESLRMTDDAPSAPFMIAGAHVGFRIVNLPYVCVDQHGEV